MASPLQSIAGTIGEQFSISKATLPENLQDQTVLIWEQDYNGLRDQWEDSGKRPGLTSPSKFLTQREGLI
jgi:hypothetical protein